MKSTADLTTARNSFALSLAPYQQASWTHCVWEVLSSVVPYWLGWYLIYRSLAGPYWITITLTLLTAGFATRTFAVFHDCAHGSFSRSHLCNVAVGYLTGITMLTSFHQWQSDHWAHHTTSGNLDQRGVGDTYFLTVDEFLALKPWQQWLYRVYRFPAVLFVIMPLYLFVVAYRVVREGRQASRVVRISVYVTNLAVALWVGGIIVLIGARSFLTVEVPLLVVISFIGGWFFVLQHQFEDIYFKRKAEWNFRDASLRGATFMQMPRVLEWLSGYLGYHHVHHLAPRVPNYYLPIAHRAIESLREVKPQTMRAGLLAMRLALWDEQRDRFVGFDAIAPRRATSATSGNR